MTEREIYEKVEDVISSYGTRRIEELLSHKELTQEKLFELRGRAQACKEIAGALRNILGYDPETF